VCMYMCVYEVWKS